MELSKQIRKYRMEANLSQEELAEKVFVSRQTISNWENDKSYPDINSLVLLSEVFQVSLDKLIKGDLEMMKKEIDVQELTKFKRDSNIFSILFVAIILLPVPLVLLLKIVGLIIYLAVAAVAIYYARKIEAHKKKYDIQTYKEIVAFMEGKSLDDIEKTREEAKRPYQKTMLAVGSAVITLVVAIVFLMIYIFVLK